MMQCTRAGNDSGCKEHAWVKHPLHAQRTVFSAKWFIAVAEEEEEVGEIPSGMLHDSSG